MRGPGRSARGAVLGLLLALAPAACTSGTGSGPSATPMKTTTPVGSAASSPQTPSSARATATLTPVDVGPTTAVLATGCPLLDRDFAQNTLGVRLARITVLRAGGHRVGCRIYALQNSPLHATEHLPGPHQPAVEVRVTRYRTAADAARASAARAAAGRNVQRHDLGRGTRGSCFQTVFDPLDHGRDWACSFSVARDAVVVRTVVTSPALNALLVTKAVRRAL